VLADIEEQLAPCHIADEECAHGRQRRLWHIIEIVVVVVVVGGEKGC